MDNQEPTPQFLNAVAGVEASSLDFDDMISWYTEHATKVFSVICPVHNGVIALEAHMPDQVSPKNPEGLVVVSVGQSMYGWRKRPDGIIGYRCECGNISLQTTEEQNIVGRAPVIAPHIAARVKEAIEARPEDYTEDNVFERVEVK